jgi:hypothetical protein
VATVLKKAPPLIWARAYANWSKTGASKMMSILAIITASILKIYLIKQNSATGKKSGSALELDSN